MALPRREMSLRVGGGRRAGTGGAGSCIWECVSRVGTVPLDSLQARTWEDLVGRTRPPLSVSVNQERLQDVLTSRFCVSLVLSLWPHTDGVGDVGILKV